MLVRHEVDEREIMITVIIDSKDTLKDRMLYVWNVVNKKIEGGRFLIEIKEFSKSRDMEKKYHAMVEDLRLNIMPERGFEAWKVLLKYKFGKEKEMIGEPLRHPAEVVTCMDDGALLWVSPSSSKFSVKEGSDFIEYLYSFGAENDIKWSAKGLEAYEIYGAK